MLQDLRNAFGSLAVMLHVTGPKEWIFLHWLYMLQELRKAFDDEAASSGKTKLMLTAAVGAGYKTVKNGYDIPVLNKSVTPGNPTTHLSTRPPSHTYSYCFKCVYFIYQEVCLDLTPASWVFFLSVWYPFTIIYFHCRGISSSILYYDRDTDGWNATDEHYSGRGWLQHMTVAETDGMRQTNTIQGGVDSSIWPWQRRMKWDRWTLFREGLTPAYDRGRDLWNATDEHCSGSG